jgi:hypothetical protein
MKKTEPFTITKINGLTLFKKMILIYIANRTKRRVNGTGCESSCYI